MNDQPSHDVLSDQALNDLRVEYLARGWYDEARWLRPAHEPSRWQSPWKEVDILAGGVFVVAGVAWLLWAIGLPLLGLR